MYATNSADTPGTPVHDLCCHDAYVMLRSSRCNKSWRHKWTDEPDEGPAVEYFEKEKKHTSVTLDTKTTSLTDGFVLITLCVFGVERVAFKINV